ncbi:MAG: hypothetical protein IJS96_06255 [Schwartzia sp.]|nr:hypothetical protein [Schwartzia sp. (in: firmicutes)]
MNIKTLAAGLLTGLLLATGMPAASADSSVEPVGQRTFLYLDKREIQLTEDVKAVDMKDGTLFLMDAAGNRKMAMKNIDDAREFVAFYVRELRVAGEPARFWEIFATVGAHDKNCGYWLISEENGQWRFVLMAEDLIAVGYKPLEWHLLSSNIENGQYILQSAIEYLPDNAQFACERQILTDWQAELVWSEKTRSFLLRQLPLG